MHLYKTTKGNLMIIEGDSFLLPGDWDELINRDGLYEFLASKNQETDKLSKQEADEIILNHLLPPIGKQEVWAAGVTYLRSRDARMEESKDAGASDCYQKVYEAERPELFFKALPERVSGHGQSVNIRKDSTWNVPEPELALFINTSGLIQGYTIGNDMSSRSIEGENPLYLPQAKMYEKSAALGPCLHVTDKPISSETLIELEISRNGKIVFEGSASINRMKRSLTELAGWLYKEFDFRYGCFLMTGTCIVPPDHFTLIVGDEVRISIGGIGTMVNTVGVKM